MTDRRSFLKSAGFAAAAAMAAPLASCAVEPGNDRKRLKVDDCIERKLIVPKGNAMRITGTFLDEISHDIPHQNWGAKEWDLDFRYMKAMGIDTVIIIRSGYRKFLTYPSKYLLGKGCYMPSVDLLELFLSLADKYGMKFYFGLYDSGRYWDTGDMSYELETNKYVIEEVWNAYGHHKSFGGWYISTEISRKTKDCIQTFHEMGRMCKDISGGLPTFISPWIDGKKAVSSAISTRKEGVSIDKHEEEWNEIFDGSTMSWMPAPSRTDTSTMTSWTRSSLSTRSLLTSTECSAGQTRRASTAICLSTSCRSNSTSFG